MVYIVGAFLLAGALVLVAFAVAIVYGLLSQENRARVAGFLMEADSSAGEPGKPSVSRLQMLIWNFVIAFAFLYVLGSLGLQDALGSLTLTPGEAGATTKLAAALHALFSPQVLMLLGISNLTYVAGKLTPQRTAQPAAPDAAAPAPSRAVDAVQAIPTHPGPGATGPAG